MSIWRTFNQRLIKWHHSFVIQVARMPLFVFLVYIYIYLSVKIAVKYSDLMPIFHSLWVKMGIFRKPRNIIFLQNSAFLPSLAPFKLIRFFSHDNYKNPKLRVKVSMILSATKAIFRLNWIEIVRLIIGKYPLLETRCLCVWYTPINCNCGNCKKKQYLRIELE